MEPNFMAILVATLMTLVVGSIWYNPKVFGTIWMRESGVRMDGKQPNMIGMFAMCLVYGFFISVTLGTMVIHQMGAFQATVDIENVAPSVLENYIQAYGTTYRTFKHGMLHGFIAGLFFALPVVGTGALFERRSWKYVLISGGYWVVTCMLMGGIICAWK